jgi:hypothetical protein
MLPSLVDPNDHDEIPTKVILSSATLIALGRIHRLAKLARERLIVAPDDEALATACDELSQIEALAREVTT